MNGTFVEGYIINGHIDGRVHCQFHQLKGDKNGTVSGRFSSSMPNLQNVPQHSPEGAKIRELFLPEVGERWWKKDMSQIEFRLMVSDAVSLDLRGAEAVADMYRNDPSTDFHKITSELAGVDRTSAKRINFGIAYGMGTKTLSERLEKSISQTKVFQHDYHRRVPFLRDLADYYKNEAETKGSIRTLLSRRRCFNTFEREADDWARTKAYFTLDPNKANYRPAGTTRAFTYAALNARIQSSAADIMKQSMVKIYESGALDVVGVPYLTVHDELDGSFDPRPPRTKLGSSWLNAAPRHQRFVD